MKMLRYTVLLRPADDDEPPGFSVIVPELPGCFSQGDTFEEALEMIQDALEGWLAVARKRVP